MTRSPAQIMEQLLSADRLWLFLDYDGTLADFAPTPEYAVPDPAVIAVVERLAQSRGIRVVVISGRRLSQVQQLLPFSNILLAGTYGVELQAPDGEIIHRARFDAIHPMLDQLKARWLASIGQQVGFFVEDKGWALALHARFAAEAAADQILSAAHAAAIELASSDEFRLLQGHRFIEVAPAIAHKALTVEYVLDRFAWPGALLFYLGDDDEDEEAFQVIRAHQGVTMRVAAGSPVTQADGSVASPQQVRQWLAELAARWDMKKV